MANPNPKPIHPEKRGCRKGSPNKSTANAREAIARFVDQGAEKALAWLQEVYDKEGALPAFRCWLDLIEYHVPKLSRTDVNAQIEPSERLLEVLFRKPPEPPKA